eukprot:CAMPEP_0180278086 /NCGR_PEP_ID=MMETSP0988-20121125/7289_1 /TAXON_ID=697907 /ORGANISM="non described non described, Strain CCMP2293" /LENGTH=123 /DNA_ID=CAMNT_0022249597 /DNA_START=271 /DNA_END=638 /DNA_ORIENTATION=-
MALAKAALGGDLEEVRRLHDEEGTNIDEETSTGDTPLYKASYNGHLPVAQFLVEKGADKNFKNMNGLTPLYVASDNGHLPVAQLLVEAGADMDARDNKVREGRGGDAGRTNGVCVSCWGVQQG